MSLERPITAQQAKDDGLPKPGHLVAGKYRVERAIGRGGMGAVFAARHEVTGRAVALKWLVRDPGSDAEATHRLVREARAAARVRHAHVVDVYDIGEHAGSLFLVMELLEGETLSQLLARKGRLELEEALRILLPVMRGIEVAHRSHVIHRDLKPSNIFLCQDEPDAPPMPRLLDFGISKVARTDDNDESLTRTGAVIGTPFYMAPEQLNHGEFDHRIDIYALGVILYQVLSGQLPFRDSSYNALIVKIATATPLPLHTLRPDLPRACCDVVMRAMSRDPARRFGDASQLIAALARFARDGRQSKPARARPGRGALLLGAIAALTIGAWLMHAWLTRATREPEHHIVVSSPPPRELPAPVAPAPTPSTPNAPLPEATEALAAAPAEQPPARAPSRKPKKQEPKPDESEPPPSSGTAPPVVNVSRDQF